MAFQTSGVDLEGIKNLQPIQYNITNDFLIQVPIKANELTGGYLGMIISVPMFLFLFIYLSDFSQFGQFRYTKLRAMGLSACIVTVMGFVALACGFFNNYYHIVIFATILAIVTIWIYIEER